MRGGCLCCSPPPVAHGKSFSRERYPANGEARNRTGDTTIFSRVLYQLSYLAAGSGW